MDAPRLAPFPTFEGEMGVERRCVPPLRASASGREGVVEAGGGLTRLCHP